MLLLVAALLTPGVISDVTPAFGVQETGQQLVSVTTPYRSGGSGFTAESSSTARGQQADALGILTVAQTSPWSIPASVITRPSGASDGTVPGIAGGDIPSQAVRADPAMLPRLTGVRLLDQLALLPRGDLAQFISDNPRAVKQLMTNPPPATEVSGWWVATSLEGRNSMVAAAPALVGNLPGVPFTVRNVANTSNLAHSIADVEASIKDLGRGEVVQARLHLQMLEKVREALRSSGDEPHKSLLTFDGADAGRAAIVVGDLSTADYVSYLVPGMFFSVDTALNTWTNIATELKQEQQDWVSILAAADPSMEGKTVATVAWIGYQTPGVTDVASLQLADQGAELIGRAIDGVKAVRGAEEPFVTIIGHSYGSTAAMIELRKGGVQVDALALIGSPGSAAQAASDLSVPSDNIFVGEAAWDPVVNSAFYGSDPGSGAFGAHKMSVAGGVDPITHRALTASAGHLGYFEPGSESMRNLALIGLDHGSLVTQGTALDASRTLK